MSSSISKDMKPAGDQPKAIKELTAGLKRGDKYQTLLGVTGSGKTFTMGHLIQNYGKPTLIVSHNKTLAAQLYEEFKRYFPKDNVHYFVSYYDYYQPEAYMPVSDSYIEKEVQINEELEQLRHAAVQSLLQNENTIIIASVSCIYNLGSPTTYQNLAIKFKVGQEITKRELLKKLLTLQYERNEINFWRGKFRQRADYVDIWPPSADIIYRVKIESGTIKELLQMEAPFGISKPIKEAELFPAKFWPSEESKREIAISNIKLDLQEQLKNLQDQKKFLEAERLKRRTEYDLALIKEVGWCKGVENYSRYLEGRNADTPPYTLIDYFPKDFLMLIDESHMTLPQVKGMYEGDKSRKQTLIEHGFRLPSALDNRPLKFDEFRNKINQCVFVSATPGEYEINKSAQVAEQIVRPTFLVDPSVEIRPTEGQVPDLINEIEIRVAKKERVLVTVLTKRLSEALAGHLKDKKIKAAFLHSEIDTLERPKILFDLRNGKYDVLVGINLLREGLDLPEVSLVAILDADKEGFLRDRTTFIQTSGRASRNLGGHVIMYADKMTKSMSSAIAEMDRRRKVQEEYNIKNNKTPVQISKEISFTLSAESSSAPSSHKAMNGHGKATEDSEAASIKSEFARDYLKELKQKLQLAQRNLQFEKAAQIQAKIDELKKTNKI
jgi:excinuclease ABC subunit B